MAALFLSGMVFPQQRVSEGEKKQIIEEICFLLREHYVFPEIADKIIYLLKGNLKKGKYDNAPDNTVFATLLTEDLRSVNQDLHLRVDPLASRKAEPQDEPDWPEIFLNFISRDKSRNYGFVSVQILEDNVGFLELRKLAPLKAETKRILTGAMDFLSNSDAVIIDLRKNTGGSPEMIQFLTSYFFKDPVRLTGYFERKTGGVYQSRTLEKFPYKKLVDIPLFILTSKSTISAPESFAYNLQVLGRATVVGEVTKGAANPGRFFRIKEKVQLLVATGYAENPITETSWEGVGIKPDVETSAETALDKALVLANEQARAYRKKKDLMVAGYINKLKTQIAEAEVLVKGDLRKGETFLNQLADEWFGKEFMNRYFFLSLGDSYRDKNDSRMAILIYKQVPRFYPDYSTGYQKLADIFWSLGDRKTALKYLVKLLELNPNDKATLHRITQINMPNSDKKNEWNIDKSLEE